MEYGKRMEKYTWRYVMTKLLIIFLLFAELFLLLLGRAWLYLVAGFILAVLISIIPLSINVKKAFVKEFEQELKMLIRDTLKNNNIPENEFKLKCNSKIFRYVVRLNNQCDSSVKTELKARIEEMIEEVDLDINVKVI